MDNREMKLEEYVKAKRKLELLIAEKARPLIYEFKKKIGCAPYDISIKVKDNGCCIVEILGMKFKK